MYAERIMLKTNAAGRVENPPQLPPNKNVEAIFLVLGPTDSPSVPLRQVPTSIAGKVQIVGDLINTIPATEWNMPESARPFK